MNDRTETSRRYYLKNRENILTNVRLYREKNSEKIKESIRKKYKENKEYRESQKEYQKKYRRENIEKVNAYQRKYRNTILKEWHNAYKREQKKQRKEKDIGTHTKDEWNTILLRHNYSCSVCGSKDDITKDHIVPITKGGLDTADNLQPLCRRNNSMKWNKMVTLLPEQKTTQTI